MSFEPLLRRMRGFLPALLSGSCAAATLAPDGPARAQSPPPAVLAAERLEAAGRPAEAADALLVHVAGHPGDVGVRWRAAQLLHRAGRLDEALAQYEAALGGSPDDPWLRIEYAEVLLDAGRAGPARERVLPLLDAGTEPREAHLRARVVAGTAAWWRGDLPAAVRAFESALALDPDRAAAAEPLRAIRGAARPWVRTALEAFDDDQPYRRAHAQVEAGLFVNPLWTVALRAVPGVLDIGDRATTAEARVLASGFVPSLRLDVAAGFGAAWGDEASWLGEAALGVRLPGRLRLRAGVARERYLWTRASADTLLMVERFDLRLGRPDEPGWAGEAALQHEVFPDGNAVRTAYAWILAPVLPGLRLGWSSSVHDADETRWSVTDAGYTPYFTPERQHVQSVLGAVSAPLGRVNVRLDGSWGAWAREQAPAAATPPDPAGVVFTERSYRPWRASAGLETPLARDLTLHARAERSETAFYALTTASVVLLLRFGDGDR